MKDITSVNNVKADKKFLERLSKWIIKETGSVNVSQRLNRIVAQGKLGKEGGN